MNSKTPLYSIKEPKSSKKPLIIVAIVAIVLAAITVAAYLYFKSRNNQPEVSQTIAQQPSGPSPQSIEGKYLFSGTIVLARAVEREAKTAGGYDYSQPFSGLSTFMPKQYDGWLADWECPTTNTVNLSYAEQVANTVFNCRPQWLDEFSKYFNFVNLANNHSGDLGQEIFLETQKHLRDAGIQIVGNYDPSEEKDACEIMALPVHLNMPDDSTQDGTLPVAFCAWHYFERDPLPGEIEAMGQYSEIMPVFGLMHVGTEYVATAGANQESVAHKIIDNGAEFVIGNSPHWVQNTEVYKDKLIVYSTGNFMFDQLEAETNRGVSVSVDMSVDYDENVGKWLALADDCKQAYDNCLDKAKEQGLSKVALHLKYEPVANITGVRQVTKKASESIQKAVEQRMNWAQTIKELGQ